MSGALNSEPMVQAIEPHAQTLEPMFSTILSMAGALVRSQSAAVCAFGARMYGALFHAFPGHVHRQDVVSQLVGHIGSGTMAEMDAALQQLLGTVIREPAAVLPHMAFVKGVLDYLEGLDNTQVRTVYTLLAKLATLPANGSSRPAEHREEDSELVNDQELNIVIRKQFSHVSARYQRMGIIGGVALLGQIGSLGEPDEPLPVARFFFFFLSFLDYLSAPTSGEFSLY